VNDPFAFFSAIRDSAGGGWGYTWGFQTTDANSTALVLQAYAAAGLAPPSGSMTALRSLQNIKCGGFSLKAGAKQNVGATIGAVMGLLQQPLPVDPQTVAGPAPAYPCP
jgi:hypothetical protein